MSTALVIAGAVAPLVAALTAMLIMSSEDFPATGVDNGQYRQTSSSSYGSSSQIASASAGWTATAGPSDPYLQAVRDAVNSGAISTLAAAAYYQYLKGGGRPLTAPGTSNGGYLGAGYVGAGQQIHQASIITSSAITSALYSANPYIITAAPHEVTSLKSEAIVAGEIIAWRAWKVQGDDLVSVVASAGPWSKTEPMSGDPAAGYGVHAYKTPHGPLLDGYVSKGDGEWVIGEVALWGDVIEHEEGYRAEFARVHSLVTWSDSVSKDRREAIKAAYLKQCPVYKIDDAA